MYRRWGSNSRLVVCLVPLLLAFSSSAIAVVPSEQPGSSLDRRALAVDGARLQACKPSQVKTADACIVAPLKPPPRTGPIKNDLYSNMLDMLAMSQYIYEIVELRRVSPEAKRSLEVTMSQPKSFGELHDILKNNLHLLNKEDASVAEAVKTLETYLTFEESEDKISDQAKISDDTKKGGRELCKIADLRDDVKHSRVHAIAVNTRKKQVDVVFRGTTNVSVFNAWCDWKTNLNALRMREIPNPIKELQASISNIPLHTGFAAALFGPSTWSFNFWKKKTKPPTTTPAAEILSDVKALMKDGYRLHVTGHSLGGAIATLFAFYAASDSEMTKYGPVYLYTFASPRVGGHVFQDAFKFLEQRGRLRHARIHNKKDKVPMVPWLMGWYKHVGMEFMLRSKKPPVVDYPAPKNLDQQKVGIIENLTSMGQLLRYHSCNEMLKRIVKQEPCLRETTLQREYEGMWFGEDWVSNS